MDCSLAMLTLGASQWLVGGLTVLFLGCSILLILTVLIQRPQGGGLSGAFGAGGGAGDTAFGARTGDALTIATIAFFVIWLVVAVGLVWVMTPQGPLSGGTNAVGEDATQTEGAGDATGDEGAEGGSTDQAVDGAVEGAVEGADEGAADGVAETEAVETGDTGQDASVEDPSAPGSDDAGTEGTGAEPGDGNAGDGVESGDPAQGDGTDNASDGGGR